MRVYLIYIIIACIIYTETFKEDFKYENIEKIRVASVVVFVVIEVLRIL